MKVYVSCKDFFKDSKEVQDAIIDGVENLYPRIQNYEKQNIEFNRIFNDDKIKYDKHGQFYTFKFKKSNIQLRILYSYMIINFKPVIVIADYFVKKRTSKDYIDCFDAMNDVEPMSLYNKAKFIYEF